MFLQKIEPIMEERKHLNVQIQANLPHDTFHTKNALTYIKVRCQDEGQLLRPHCTFGDGGAHTPSSSLPSPNQTHCRRTRR